tara:strand:- start:1893 stop:2861 length:969 start_codon:yes stop_codon:yes gene_type:complete
MSYSLTIFKAPRWWEEQQRFVFDNKTHRRLDFDTWDGFSEFLYTLSGMKLDGKQDAELISPAIFEANSTRKNENVLAWASWAAVDVDDHVFEGNLEDELRSKFGHLKYICYSTASSTSEHPKFRLVFPLTGKVEVDRIKHFWFALNSELEGLGDKQTKDLSRMYYIPASYSGSNNFIFSNDGDDVDPHQLMARWAYDERKNNKSFMDRLPPAVRDQVLEYRKSKLDNYNLVWNSYQDCPFWPKKMADEYRTISGGGWYRQMYRIMIAVAGNAITKGYPINANQIEDLCRQFDMDTGKWYESRPMNVEANNALEYAYKNGNIA